MLNASSGSKQGQTPERVPLKKPLPLAELFFLLTKKPTLGSVGGIGMGGRVAIPQDTDPTRSLEGDLAAHFFDGLLEGFGFVLGHAFLDGLGCSLDHGLGITKTQAGGLTHSLEDLDLG